MYGDGIRLYIPKHNAAPGFHGMPAKVNVACIGDSWTYGDFDGSHPNIDYPMYLRGLPFCAARLGAVWNLGINGRTLGTFSGLNGLIQDFATGAATKVDPTAMNIAVIMIGENDIGTSWFPAEAASWVTAYRTFLGTVRAAGYSVVVGVKITTGAGSPGDKRDNVNTVNNTVDAAYTDGLIDFIIDRSRLTNTTYEPPYFFDGGHMLGPGNLAFARVVNNAFVRYFSGIVDDQPARKTWVFTGYTNASGSGYAALVVPANSYVDVNEKFPEFPQNRFVVGVLGGGAANVPAGVIIESIRSRDPNQGTVTIRYRNLTGSDVTLPVGTELKLFGAE